DRSSDTDDDSDGGQGPPENAKGPLANAQRLKRRLEDNGPMRKDDAAVALVADGPLESDDFQPALKKARKKGWIEVQGDELKAIN
ncbi:hypothetical protein QA786_14770, partial [Listeria monocytogenes]|uniref:hypothetical protein n=1 Tax=Listeria monocytogenes TaxID=1639 RepID=UPI0024989F7C